MRFVAHLLCSAALIAGSLRYQSMQDYCFPQAEAALGGVHLGGAPTQLQAQLGVPISSEHDSAANDGGMYQFTIFRYAHVTAEVNDRDRRVQLLIAVDSAASTPSGVRVGMSIEEVAKRLRAPEAEILSTARRWEPIFCSDGRLEPSLSVVTFEFTGAPGPFEPPGPPRVRTLKRIEMTVHGP
jgi:hypothetical protein